MSDLSKGVVLCLLSQLLFSVLYLFSHWMQPISGTDVFVLRMVMTAAGLWLMTAWTLGLQAMPRFVQQFLTSPRRWLLFLLVVLVLKTPVQVSAYITYGLIWAGLLLLVVNGWRGMQKSHHKQV